jgi:hypothetical protein
MGTKLALAVAAAALLPAIAGAQDTTRTTKRPTVRRQAPIEIRGQVPTPQVVTVRPREVPAYSRQVLVPNFYDHDFWPAILPGYRLVARRQITGQVPVDSMTARMTQGADSLRTRTAAPGDSVRQVTPVTPGAPATPPDTTARPGTPPARTPR